MAGATGLEPAASCVTGRRSNQLNYAPAFETSIPDLLLLLPSSARAFPKIPKRGVTGQRSQPRLRCVHNRTVLLDGAGGFHRAKTVHSSTVLNRFGFPLNEKQIPQIIEKNKNQDLR